MPDDTSESTERLLEDLEEKDEYEQRVRTLEAEVARYEDVLDEQERYLDRVTDIFAVLDTDWRFRYINEGAREAFSSYIGADLPKEELIGRCIWDEVHRAEDSNLYEACHEAVATQEPIWYEAQHGGGEKWVLTRIFPSETGLTYFSREITDRKEREEELRRKNERLDAFASLVSHDLRNPLNVATGRLELARSEFDSDDLDIAAGALDRMEELIDDLLTLARTDNTDVEPEPIEFGGTVRSAWFTVDTKDATLDVDWRGHIRADPTRVTELFENLFRNAVEHGPDDVTITAGRTDDGFYVEDDGPGIPPADRTTVFESGYTTNPDGTGLGLRIVEEIAEDHGWNVTVTDATDGGARFEFTGVRSPKDGEGDERRGEDTT